MKEIWKDIVGYEGLYQVSNYGRVKSITRTVIRKDGRTQTFYGKLISPHKQNGGYYMVDLFKNNIRKNMLVHRAVACSFIPNPHGFPCVNHIDSNRPNCYLSNLEWCTQSYNAMYSYSKNSRRGKMNWKRGEMNHNSKAVLMYDKSGEFIKRYGCIMDAQRELGIRNNGIVSCLKGRNHTAGGYIWKYA